MTRAVSSRWAVGRFPVSGAQWQQHLSISTRAALAMENIVLSCTLYYCSTVQAHHIRLNICENLTFLTKPTYIYSSKIALQHYFYKTRYDFSLTRGFSGPIKFSYVQIQQNITWFPIKCACQIVIFYMCLRENILDPALCGGFIIFYDKRI